jgi:hypothetical protein
MLIVVVDRCLLGNGGLVKIFGPDFVSSMEDQEAEPKWSHVQPLEDQEAEPKWGRVCTTAGRSEAEPKWGHVLYSPLEVGVCVQIGETALTS